MRKLYNAIDFNLIVICKAMKMNVLRDFKIILRILLIFN